MYRSPFNIRPLLGIKPHVSTKGMGYMAWGYLKLYVGTGDPSYAARAKHCLDWLIANKSPFYREYWGNNFPFCTRGGKTPAFEPIVPWTTLIGQAFIEAHSVLGDARYLEVIKGIEAWLLRLPREQTESGACISYVAFKQNSIHNSNMLAGAFLAQSHTLTGKPPPLRPLAARWCTAARVKAPTVPGCTAPPRNISGTTTSTPDTTSIA